MAHGKNFSFIIIGEYRDGDLYYVKRVAAGFTPHLRDQVFNQLKPHLEVSLYKFARTEPVGSRPYCRQNERVCPVMPERRCELEFVERTHSGRLRHALFRRLLS